MFPSKTIFRKFAPHILLPLYGLCVAALTFLSLVFTLRVHESGADFLFGYSRLQVFLSVFFLLVCVSFLGFTLRLYRHPQQSLFLREFLVNNRALLWSLLGALCIFWLARFLPSYRYPFDLYNYALRLFPLLNWALAVNLLTLSLVLCLRNAPSLHHVFSNRVFQNGAIVFFLLVLLFALIAWTGIGVRQREDYWYSAGVPVLLSQVVFALLIGIIFNRLEAQRPLHQIRYLDAILFLAVWLAAAWLWARDPLRASYFFTDTGINPLQPYSDSATFDTGSQYALIGQGLFNGRYFERPLYSAFLVYLHAAAGQNLETLMAVQAALFAVFPALIYLIGKEMHSRAFGAAAASMILARGINAIVLSNEMDLASPKMMLTDFPAAIGVALLVLLVLRCGKSPSKEILGVWIGGTLGAILFLRIHALVLLPFVLAYLFFTLFKNWKQWLSVSLLIILGMASFTLPWDIRNAEEGSPVFSTYFKRLESIFRSRFGVSDDAYIPSPLEAPNVRAAARRERALFAPPPLKLCEGHICSIGNNFFHNLVTAFLSLPSSLTLDTPFFAVRDHAPYWQPDWTGKGMRTGEFFFIFINLVFLSIGIGAAWTADKRIGLFPIYLFFVYMFANGLARTSGGRYLVPADWLLCLYFLLGVFYFFSQPPQTPQDLQPGIAPVTGQPQRLRVLFSLGMVFLLGALIPLADLPFPARYPPRNARQLAVELEEQGWLARANLSLREAQAFARQRSAVILKGRLLYPRYYIAGKGEPKQVYPYLALDYPRLAFTMIGPFPRVEGFILKAPRPAVMPHAADAVVIGCRYPQYIEALVFIVLSEPGGVALRDPWTGLRCPP